VRIVPLVKVEAESGYVLRGLSIVPSVARVVGPEKSLAAVEVDHDAAHRDLERERPVFPHGPARHDAARRRARRPQRRCGSPAKWRRSSSARSPPCPLPPRPPGSRGSCSRPSVVTVTMRGPESKVNTLTKDSVRVVAHLVGRAGPGGYARLTVTAPPGIRARAVPDSVGLKRKTGRG